MHIRNRWSGCLIRVLDSTLIESLYRLVEVKYQLSIWVSCMCNQSVGVRFHNQVYFFMSQGLIDIKILEQVQNQKLTDDTVLAPSYLIKET